MLETLFARINADWKDMPHDEFLGFVKPKCQEILTFDRLKDLLATAGKNKKLRVKLGTDATGSDLHIGHIVPLLLLKQFQKTGHHIDFIIGDFTAKIGDPSERTDARKALTDAEVKTNAKGFTKQISPYIDIKKGKVHFNSEWLSKMKLSETLGYLQKMSLSSVTQREDFRKRLAAGNPVSLAETVYGFLMGLDSLHLKSDIEIGGVDQLINFQQCRELMSAMGLVPEIALCTPIIEGTDGSGKKMSKSVGNTINLSASFEDKFGKIMSIPDKLILSYYIAFTDIHENEIEQLKKEIETNPLEMKKQLGMLLIALETKSLDQGKKERENFERKFAKKELTDDDFVTIQVSADNADGSSDKLLFDVLLPQFESKSELRRLFEQGAVKNISNNEDGEAIPLVAPATSMKVKIGKRHFFKIVLQ
jgi:tyrosyl-tRNA synthetase